MKWSGPIIRRLNGAVDSLSRVLATGGKDGRVLLHDPSVHADSAQSSVLYCIHQHTREVCGLAFSASGLLLASGGSDNRVYVFDLRMLVAAHAHTRGTRNMHNYLHCITLHTSSVRALAFSPADETLLATGGGASDRRICLWRLSIPTPDELNIYADDENTSTTTNNTNDNSTITNTSNSSNTSNNSSSLTPQRLSTPQSRSVLMSTPLIASLRITTPLAQPIAHTHREREVERIRRMHTRRLQHRACAVLLDALDTASQVCCVAWSADGHLLLSAHGFGRASVLCWRVERERKSERETFMFHNSTEEEEEEEESAEETQSQSTPSLHTNMPLLTPVHTSESDDTSAISTINNNTNNNNDSSTIAQVDSTVNVQESEHASVSAESSLAALSVPVTPLNDTLQRTVATLTQNTQTETHTRYAYETLLGSSHTHTHETIDAADSDTASSVGSVALIVSVSEEDDTHTQHSRIFSSAPQKFRIAHTHNTVRKEREREDSRNSGISALEDTEKHLYEQNMEEIDGSDGTDGNQRNPLLTPAQQKLRKFASLSGNVEVEDSVYTVRKDDCIKE